MNHIAFFCSTPYHVLVATWLRFSSFRDTEADMYLLDHFKDAQAIHHTLTDTQMFSQVKLLHNKKGIEDRLSTSRPVKYLQRISMQIWANRLVRKYLQLGDAAYDQVLLGSPVVTIQLALKVLYRRNPNLQIHLFEDGFAGYHTDQWKASTVKKIFNRATGQHRYTDRYDSLLLFKPELFTGHIRIPVSQIPPIPQNNKAVKNLFNTIFRYTEQSAIREKVIFFEQPIQGIPELNNAVQNIIEHLPTENLLIKPHPRSTSTDYGEIPVFHNRSVPWEIIGLNTDIEDKVLISFFSTVAFSNKIIFDTEPVVILLFEMEELKPLYTLPRNSRDFIYAFRDTYLHPERISFPRSRAELYDILTALL